MKTKLLALIAAATLSSCTIDSVGVALYTPPTRVHVRVHDNYYHYRNYYRPQVYHAPHNRPRVYHAPPPDYIRFRGNLVPQKRRHHR